ncbi:TetR/AcrR family transcriptional regulator [Aurantiacibacter rhizosphaerae]|uniref:TetR family transcriptional regulator n=1 Tax=Aurantiacibacter rhizosphaerae TaxID=2691582 RepID=A0A844XBY2_9SPHN|nr:TetR/AcrR family transcriptional regulator [Aurantiacibacter rhizosphaerae]MWV27144.1 TetR family transcriptional regulator [Aurantiacibacter rhizosphaerae]
MRTRANILSAAFDIFGEEQGLFARIEDIATGAGVTRATFYNHFSGMGELREALSYEVTHDFLAAVTHTISQLPDARKRAAVAVRFYLDRARSDTRWGWSMLNLSASGRIFGAETYEQAERTVQEGMDEGHFLIPSSKVGRDILLGSTLAAMGSVTREETAADYPEIVSGYILHALGVSFDDAKRIASMDLPELLAPRNDAAASAE